MGRIPWLAAAPSDDDQLRYKQLQDVVEEVAIASGHPAPRANLWATHPPMAKRIAALKAMAYQGKGS